MSALQCSEGLLWAQLTFAQAASKANDRPNWPRQTAREGFWS